MTYRALGVAVYRHDEDRLGLYPCQFVAHLKRNAAGSGDGRRRFFDDYQALIVGMAEFDDAAARLDRLNLADVAFFHAVGACPPL